MNQLTLLVVVLVLFCYFGGKYCPSVLKKNKKILLGVAGGLVLCSFFGLRLEGFRVEHKDGGESWFESTEECWQAATREDFVNFSGEDCLQAFLKSIGGGGAERDAADRALIGHHDAFARGALVSSIERQSAKSFEGHDRPGHVASAISRLAHMQPDAQGGVDLKYKPSVGSAAEQAAREATLAAADRRDQASHQGRWGKDD